MKLRSRIANLDVWLWDKLLGINTGGYESFLGPLNHGYHSKSYFFTWRCLLPLGIEREDVLYDIGCGAGRILCIASLGKAKKCVGVELSPILCERASANAKSLRFRHAPIEIARGDAVSADYSSGTVFVLYNPFGTDILKAVLEKIQHDVERHPRRVRFTYINPTGRRVFDECKWLSQFGEGTLRGSPTRTCYYENFHSAH